MQRLPQYYDKLMRLFIAINIPGELKQLFSLYQKHLSSGSVCTKPEAFMLEEVK